MKILPSFLGCLALLLFLTVQSAHAAAPTISSLSPADGVTNVSPTATTLSMTFSTAVQGTLDGSIYLYRIEENGSATLAESSVGSGSQITGSGTTTLVFTLSSSLGSANTSFYVQIDNDAIINGVTAEAFAGIANTTTWNFKTLGGGGSGGRQAKLARLQQIREAAAKSSSSSSESSTTESSTTQTTEEHKAAPPGLQDIQALRQKAAAEKNTDRRVPLREVQAKTSAVNAEKATSSLKERACGRVERHFKGNRKMIDRINERLLKRFNFTCDL